MVRNKLSSLAMILFASLCNSSDLPPEKIPNPGFTKEKTLNLIKSFNHDLKEIKYEQEPIEGIKETSYIDWTSFSRKTKLDTLRRDYWQSPEETDSLGKGDCEDKAIWLNDKLRKNNLDVKLVWGKFHLLDRSYHVWQEFEVEGSKYIIESSVGISIYEKDLLDKDFSSLYVNFLLGNQKSKIKEYQKRTGKKLYFKN